MSFRLRTLDTNLQLWYFTHFISKCSVHAKPDRTIRLAHPVFLLPYLWLFALSVDGILEVIQFHSELLRHLSVRPSVTYKIFWNFSNNSELFIPFQILGLFFNLKRYPTAIRGTLNWTSSAGHQTGQGKVYLSGHQSGQGKGHQP